ncbi:MAG TPA: hypothetical protein VNX68_19645 [Nitrosopumilaceae archaeon]|nr:hypothetical protein [Nitrosopumilaceae archaeon]
MKKTVLVFISLAAFGCSCSSKPQPKVQFANPNPILETPADANATAAYATVITVPGVEVDCENNGITTTPAGTTTGGVKTVKCK